MSYIASQIAVWIVLAVFLGFAIGWLAKSRREAGVKKRRRF